MRHARVSAITVRLSLIASLVLISGQMGAAQAQDGTKVPAPKKAPHRSAQASPAPAPMPVDGDIPQPPAFVVEELDGRPVDVARFAELYIPPTDIPTDAELLGVPKESRPDVLTLEDAYALALIEARSPTPRSAFAGAQRLEAANLAAQRKLLDVGNFGQFRTEYFAVRNADGTGTGRFRDPSEAYLKLMVLGFQIQHKGPVIDRTGRDVTGLAEMIRLGGTGVSQEGLDRASDAALKLRQEFEEQLQRYRDAREHLNVQLGLAPRVAVVPNVKLLDAFAAVFSDVDLWYSNEGRQPGELSKFGKKLPAPVDVALGGTSVLAEKPELERLLQAGEDLAIANRRRAEVKSPPAESEEQLALRVRGRIRSLRRTAYEYRLEKERWVISLRRKDHAQRLIFAPPAPAGVPAVSVTDATAMLAQCTVNRMRCEQRLVAYWTTYLIERAALYRDLGAMPYETWASFLSQFTPAPDRK